MRFMEILGKFTPESVEFLKKMIASGATGPATHWPPATRPVLDSDGKIAPDMSMAAARAEAEAGACCPLRSFAFRTGTSTQR